MATLIKKKKVGRPSNKDKWREAISIAMTKLSPEIISKLKDAFAINANIEQACFYAEIHPSSYYRWCEEYPELKDEFNRMRKKLPLAAKTNIATAIHNKDLFHSRWLIERQEPEEYGEKITITDNIKDDDFSILNKEYKEKYRQLLYKKIDNEHPPMD